jgi:hypothetical protein
LPTRRSFLPGVVYDTILAALIGPLAISIHDRRDEVGTARLVSTFLDERPRPSAASPASSTSPSSRSSPSTGLTARLFYLQIVDGGRLATLRHAIGPSWSRSRRRAA